MKKLLFALSIALVATTTVNAQSTEKSMPENGGGKQFDRAGMKEKQKAKLKEDLQLSEAQATVVVKLQTEFMDQMRSFRDITPEERASKMKDIKERMKADLTRELKDEKLAEKVMQYQEAKMKQRMERRKEAE